MEARYSPNMPNVVVLHSGDIAPELVKSHIGIVGTSTVYGFTDTYPEENPLNVNLRQVASRSDHLIVEDKLYDQMTPDARLAIFSQGIMSHPHTFWVFERETDAVQLIAAPGFLSRDTDVVLIEIGEEQ